MAAFTREASTVFNGMQLDRAQFKKDVQRFITGARQAHK